jgi:hypothetical protein
MSGGRSFINVIQQSNTKTAEVKVGDGVTFLHWSDRTPGTVAEVINCKSGPKKDTPRKIGVRPDDYKVISGSPHDGSAKYEITENPDAPITWFLLTPRGWKGEHGGYLRVGDRDVYQDPSF